MLKQSKEISQIYFIIDDHYMHDYERVRVWFFEPHKFFGGQSPMDLIQSGKATNVLQRLQLWRGRK